MPSNTTDDRSDFAAVFVQHAKGRAADEATRLLAKAVEAVEATGKDATITIKLKLKKYAKIPGAYYIEDTITASIPEDKRTSMWFGDGDNGLHRNPPNQDDLFGNQPIDEAAGNK